MVDSADSEIVMVDECFMVDGPCANHAEKAVNHICMVDGAFGEMVDGAMSNFKF